MIRRAVSFALSLLLVAPIGLLILLSLTRHWAWPALLPTEWQMRQWTQLASEPGGLGVIVLRSLAISAGVALLATGLGFATSHSVARQVRRDQLMALLHVPFAVSPVVVGVSLLYVFLRLDVAGTVAAVMLAQWLFAYSYAVILLSGFWNPHVESLDELASSLGAGRQQVWTKVLMPMARPLLAMCLLQTFLISWFDYALTVLVGGGQVATLTITLYQYLNSGDIRLAATCALLLLIPPLIALCLGRQLLSASIAVPLEPPNG